MNKNEIAQKRNVLLLIRFSLCSFYHCFLHGAIKAARNAKVSKMHDRLMIKKNVLTLEVPENTDAWIMRQQQQGRQETKAGERNRKAK